ncbi:DEAD/DEAH box helicase family protein, partial [Streptomyces sp. SM12]
AGLEKVLADGYRRAWVVLPPGLGKTLTGLEAARRLGRPVVVLGPNTAIQGQWIREWAAFRPSPPPAGTGRDLAAPVTVLTYQALASFDPDAEVDEDGAGATAHLHRLRPGGRALVAALRAADWVCLLDDWVRRCLRVADRPADRAAEERIRAALPSVGHRLTAHGVRRDRSPLDRVLARSAARTAAVTEILAAEDDAPGERLRAVVVCDHERATATLPSRLDGVLDAQAGSARLVLAELAADRRTASLAPLLVTGRTVAADPGTARAFAAFAAFCAERADGLDLAVHEADGIPGAAEITGRWTSRRWVPLATVFFEEGHSRALIGTRALLGEGWNARRVNTLVDLTEATTATAVVQTRGRALRLDPGWPEKTATTWSVVCVAPGHPRGTTDWDRFVRKHEGYLGVAESGAVLGGVAHVDPGLSPYAPPDAATFDAFNAAMLTRARDRA